MLRTAQHVLQTLGDAVAPPRCIACLSEGTWLCNHCHREVTSTPYQSRCLVCGKEQAGGRLCRRHSGSTPIVGSVCAASYKAEWAKRGISWLKFRGIHGVASPLVHLLIPRLPIIAPISQLQAKALIVPIPLHRRKLRNRGFNQSAVLAQELSRLTKIPCQDVLTRSKATFAQAQLPNQVRAENMEDAFALEQPLPNDRSLVLLLDDVTTTGSTLNEAAKALKEKHPYVVWGVTIARG